MIERVHHIDFVVRDLAAAAERFTEIFDRDPLPRERLEHRGIELVRFDLGNVWIILVRPIEDDSPVMEYLERHGEGFFHIAYLSDDVEAEARRLAGAGIRSTTPEPRRGVDGWKLVDLAMDETFGVMTQIIEEPER